MDSYKLIHQSKKTNSNFVRFRDCKSSEALVILHDFYNTSESYISFVEKFSQTKKLNYYLLDFSGFGLSKGKRHYCESFDTYRNELSELLLDLVKNKNMKKIYLMGHGFGGIVAVDYLVNHKKVQKALLKVIIINPIFALKFRSQFLSKIILNFGQLDLVNQVKIKLSELLCFQKEEKKVVKKNGQEFSIKFISELRKSGRKLFSEGYLIDIPVLLINSSSNQLLNVKKNIYFAKSINESLLKSITIKSKMQDLINMEKNELMMNELSYFLEEENA